MAEATDFKFGTQFGFGKAHHKITLIGKIGHSLGLQELPKNVWFHFNIYTMAEASDFKFGTQFGFAKAHHIITPRGKSVGGLGLGELHKILGFPYNIFATAVSSDFKFGAQLGFAKAHHKIIRRRKGGHGPGLGKLPKIWGSPSIFTQWLKLRSSNLVYSLGLPSPTIKPHSEDKWACPWFSEAPIYLEFPFNISATAALSC